MSKPCPHCQLTTKHGTRYGCCSGCGEMFAGQSAFDAHQRNLECVDVQTDQRKDGELRFYSTDTKARDGVIWHLTTKDGTVNPWAKANEAVSSDV